MLPGGGEFYTGFDSYIFVCLGSVLGGERIRTSVELIPGSLAKYKDHRAYRVWHVWNPEQFGMA